MARFKVQPLCILFTQCVYKSFVWPPLLSNTDQLNQEPSLCPDKDLTCEPWPKPLGQWGEAARATCCSGIMKLDTAIRMIEHTEFSTLTTLLAADHSSQV